MYSDCVQLAVKARSKQKHKMNSAKQAYKAMYNSNMSANNIQK